MERMVLDAVKGTTTAVPSRTDQLLLKARAGTPFRVPDSDSSDAVIQVIQVIQDGPRLETSDSGESLTLGDISTPDESDSTGEMALITQSFKKSKE